MVHTAVFGFIAFISFSLSWYLFTAQVFDINFIFLKVILLAIIIFSLFAVHNHLIRNSPFLSLYQGFSYLIAGKRIRGNINSGFCFIYPVDYPFLNPVIRREIHFALGALSARRLD